ncbi:MAG: NACHT domain-containing protein [Leptolyngbya sp. SIO1D8]|nr:NACHT domain-containing protein [Leptolyngbya sp. SIO1D8]
MSELISVSKRRTLVRTLNKLPPPKFEQLRDILNVPHSVIPEDTASQGSRGVALLEWAESSLGCGLSKLEQGLEEVMTAPTDAVTKTFPAIRTKLLRRLQGDINTRLENSLHQLIKIDLQMEEQRQSVGQNLISKNTQPATALAHPSLNHVFQSLGAPETLKTELASTQNLVTVLQRQDVQGKLLILGEPGAGKTTELVKLADALLTQIKQKKQKLIPIIFELSDWKKDIPIAQWLIEQIQAIYQIPKGTSQQWLNDEQIIPLLDGLDELGLDKQQKCVIAINRFLRDQAYPYMVVCCRREEYEQGQVNLTQLNGALYIQPLTPQQIQNYLKDLNRFNLWENIEASPELLALSHQPLFLTMLVVAYQGRPIRSETDLFNAYIEKQLSDPTAQGAYPPQQAPSQRTTLHYLRWLAGHLETSGKTEYLIEEMQPSWLSPSFQWLYGAIVTLLFGLLFGILFGLSGRVLGGVIGGFILGLLGGLIGGLIGGLDKTIAPRNRLTWSMEKGLSLALRSGLIAGLVAGLIFQLSAGLVIGLFFALIVKLLFGLEKVSLAEQTVPNQNIRQSLQNSLTLTLLVGLSFGLLVGLSFGLTFGPMKGLIGGLVGGLISGLIGGLSFGLSVGLETVAQHYTLRFLLTQEGSFPWDCVRFLDHAAEHRFIQRVGGRYRFVHDLLRKHFATGELPSLPSP